MFDKKCINCDSEMEVLHSEAVPISSRSGVSNMVPQYYSRNMKGLEYIYWCPECGTILEWYDSDEIREGNWKRPERGENLIRSLSEISNRAFTKNVESISLSWMWWRKYRLLRRKRLENDNRS